MKNSVLPATGLSTSPGLSGPDSRSNFTRIEKYRLGIFLFFFLLAVVPAFSQPCVWKGNNSSDWFDAGNWLGGVPDASKGVYISPGPNNPVISSAGIILKWLVVYEGGVLTIAAAGTLTLNNSSTNGGILSNAGTVHNHGAININAIASVTGYYGIENDNVFTNYAGGVIRIDRQYSSGIENQGNFTNAGDIIIGGESSAGESSAGYAGIRNKDIFTNDTGGEITIDRTNVYGIFNEAGTFQNNALITIGGEASPGLAGISAKGLFNNNAGGEITIDRSEETGLFVSGTFQNNAILTIGGVASPGTVGLGVVNVGKFNNETGGQLEIYRYASYGLQLNYSNGVVLNNNATIIIGSAVNAGSTGIDNVVATINNNACASIEMYGKFFNLGGTVNNAGFFTISSTVSHTNSALTNDGIIEYRQGGPIPNVTNNDLIVQDIAGGCGAYSPALQIGGANSFTPASTWYKNAAQTQVAGAYNLATNTFTATNLPGLGTYPLYFNITDNSNGCTQAVTLDYTIVNDATPPTVVCKDATVNLDLAGHGNLTTSMVFQSGSDNCGTVNQQSVSPASFTCSDIGVHTATLTVNDGNGNTGTCTATVTVADNTAPTILCTNVTVYLDASGSAVVTTASILISGSDNCGTINPGTVSPNTFDCDRLGLNLVSLLVNDGHGNAATCSAWVDVLDNIGPAVVCKNATVSLDASGSVGITTASVFQSGSDNCGTVNQQSVSPNTFTCANIGANTVTLTVNDGLGHTGACTATVTVTENSAPTVVCKNASVNLDASGSAGITTASVFQSGSDNCGTVNHQSVSPASFTCSNIGANTVTLTVNDGHGNTGTCTATVTVTDNSAPTVVCKNATVAPDASGSATIPTSSVFQSGSDNCGTVNQVSVTPGTLTCNNFGANVVTLLVNDGHGNTATCTATVTVADNIAPTVVCKNATVNLNASGSAAITTASVFQSGSDNCGTVNQQSVSPNAFTCSNVGANTVTLTVSDGHGNAGACTATVTVADNIAPAVVCKNTTVNLGASGSGALSPAAVFQSGTDNCGTVNPGSVSPNAFGCNNLGSNTVILTANDGHGNTASCTATVTVADAIVPTMLCKPAMLILDATGNATLTVAQVNNGSYDNCGLASMTLSRTAFSCADIGSNTVFLDGVDGSGNRGACSAVVTVADLTLPVAKCKNITANLNASGTVSPAPSAVNNGSSDNCGFSLTLSPATFHCGNVGANAVTLKVTDNGGNTATCTAVVTVKDVTAPTALCKNPTVYLDNTGHVTISPATVNNGSTDACGIQSMSVSNSQFDCGNISGTYPVVLTVRDLYNNVSACTATVTIRDNLAPAAVCENVSVRLNAQGIAVVSGAALASDSYDNCSVWSYAPQVKAYTTANLGLNSLTITVKDWSGNPAACTAQVTVLPYNGGGMLLQNDRTYENADEVVREQRVENRAQDPSGHSLDLALLPNPAIAEVTLRFQLPAGQGFLLRVFDLTGRLVVEREEKGLEGDNLLPLDLAGLRAGLYIVELRSGVYRAQKQLVVQRD